MDYDGAILIIFHGGKADNDASLRQAVKAVRSEGHRVEVRVTWEADDATRFARSAAESGARTIVAAGGDGTLNQVVAGIVEAGRLDTCAVGILPLGTANDFAHQCGLSDDIESNLRAIIEGAPRRIDLGMVNGCPFVNMATAGFGTDVTVETPEDLKQALGRAAYLLTGLRKFSSVRSMSGRLRGPDFDWEGPFLVIAVGNGRHAGGGIILCPDASLHDGLLDIFVLPALQPDQVLRSIPRLMAEGLSGIEGEGFRHRAPWLEVSVPDSLHVNLDGEPITGTNFRFEVLPDQLWLHTQRSS